MMLADRFTLNSYPIITSLLDVDFYKLTMGQFAYFYNRDTQVRYALINRTKSVSLGQAINESKLYGELDHIERLRFSLDEIDYLRRIKVDGQPMFAEEYLQFLQELQLPHAEVHVSNGQLEVETVGSWPEVMLWETLILSVVNEMYNFTQMLYKLNFQRDVSYAEGVQRLAEKLHVLNKDHDITYCDFGTRRRFSRDWHEYVVQVLRSQIYQCLGTSNTDLARRYGLVPMGTSAHELFMVRAALAGEDDDALRNSHNQVLQDWWKLYGRGLSIALTDTFGSEFFFSDMTPEQARGWKGLRHDSGDPFAFGERAIRFYREAGLSDEEIQDKLIVFSDGLELPLILELAKQFSGRIKTTFGWGTNLTNDLGLPTLSLVVKAVEADGYSTVKLSDNLAKAMGAKEDIARYARVFDYANTKTTACKY